MIPSLSLFTLLTAVVLLVVGLPLAVQPRRFEPLVRAFPRHRATAVATLLLGGGWFLWEVLQLGPSDFGNYRHLLFALFAATLVASLFYVRDFLAVRGVAILTLMAAHVGLQSAYGLYEIPARLFLVSILYLLIVAALYFGTVPYRMRDCIRFLYADLWRMRLFGSVFSAAGLGLLVCIALY